MTKLWSRRTDLETEWKILYPNSGKPDWFCTFVKAICCAKPACLNTFMYNNLFLLLFDISPALISNILFQFWLLVISSRGLQFMKGRFSFINSFLYITMVLWLIPFQEKKPPHIRIYFLPPGRTEIYTVLLNHCSHYSICSKPWL